MGRIRTVLVIAAVGSTAAFGAGCGGGGGGGTTPASTSVPTEQTTIPATDTAPTDTGTATASGDKDAGKTFFEGTCQACHLSGGTEAGAGPKLAGAGLTADAIKKQIQTPRGSMPPNLASGADLDNVIAFVTSIQ